MDEASKLIAALGASDDYFERQKAAWALVRLGEAAVDAVARALEEGEFSDLRYKSAWILGKIGSLRGVEPLSRVLLNDPDHVVREWCAAALEAVKSREAVPVLVLAMKRDSAKDVRLRAAMALRTLEASCELREMCRCAEPETRGMAVTALAKIRDRESLPDAAKLISDEDREVRRRATAFMGEVAEQAGDRKSGEKAAVKGESRKASEIEKATEREKIRESGEISQMPEEPEGAETSDPALEEVRQRALESIEIALRDRSAEVRTEALKSLGKIKGKRACEMALSALPDPDWQVRYTAVTALGEIGHSDAFDALVEIMFGKDDEEIRSWAAWSLGEIRDERAIEPLKRAYRTCPTEVMNKARDSLVEIFNVEP